jgi:hypothetical protein
MQTYKFYNGSSYLELEYVTEGIGLGLAPVEIKTSKIYNQNGVRVNNVTYGARPFSLKFDLNKANAAAVIAERRNIIKFFADNGPKYFIFNRDGWEVYLYPVYIAAQFDTIMDEIRVRTGNILQFIAENPFFKKDIPLSSVATEIPLFEYPSYGLEYPSYGIEYSMTEEEINIPDNEGDVISPGLIRFIGPANAPWVENTTTGERLELKSSMPVDAGEILEVDSEACTVEIIDEGGVRHNAFNYKTDDSDFIHLALGANVVQFGSGGGAIGYIQGGGVEYYAGV